MYNSELGNELLTKVKDNMMKMFDWYASAYSNQNRNRPYSTGTVSAEQPAVARPQSGFKSFLKEINSIEKKNELEKYLDEPNFDDEDDYHYTQEDLDASEKVVRELCESLALSSFGAAPVPSATSPAVDPFAAGPSHSRPFGRD
ncbi:hypothetical protein P8452_03370 [Trifolium repens]|nr:hypothetical protein P8452_03370 [Trifolium repens]